MKLIDKDDVVAEIERLRKIQPTDEFQPKEQNKIDWLAGKEFAIITLQVFLDTLEVKEVNISKEIDNYLLTYWNGEAEKLLHPFLKKMCVHFFELGMQVNNKAQKGEKV